MRTTNNYTSPCTSSVHLYSAYVMAVLTAIDPLQLLATLKLLCTNHREKLAGTSTFCILHSHKNLLVNKYLLLTCHTYRRYRRMTMSVNEPVYSFDMRTCCLIGVSLVCLHKYMRKSLAGLLFPVDNSTAVTLLRELEIVVWSKMFFFLMCSYYCIG